MSRSARAIVAILSVALLAAGLSLAPVASSSAAPGIVQVYELRPQLRAEPRHVDVQGLTDDGHLIYVEEQDSDVWDPGPMAWQVGTDAMEPAATLDKAVTVVGNRLVSAPDGGRLAHRLVGDGAWGYLTLPDGFNVLGITADGVLAGPGDRGTTAAYLVPWDGSAPVLVDGVPAGARLSGWFGSPRDDHRVVITGTVASGDSWETSLYVVDTVRRSVTVVPASNPACPANRVSDLAISGGRLAWLNPGNALCRTTVASDGTVGPTTSMPGPQMPLGYDCCGYLRLIIAGDRVVLASTRPYDDSWGTQEGARPLYVIDPDGTQRTLWQWADGVLDAGGGKVVTVLGFGPGQSSIKTVDVVTGEITGFRAITPLMGRFTSIFSDGSQLLVTDQSQRFGALRRYTSPPGGTSYGESTVLATRTSGPVAAGGGVLAFSQSVPGDSRSSTILQPDGTSVRSTMSWPRYADARSVGDASGFVVDTSTGTGRDVRGVLQDGVVYRPSAGVPGASTDRVVAQDVATKLVRSTRIPGCPTVTKVGVAGSWLMVSCQLAAGAGTDVAIFDLRTGTILWRLPTDDGILLGNGFLVRRDPSGALTWTPLAGEAPAWSALGRAAPPDGTWSDHPERMYAVSVGRTAATVAWFRWREAYVAVLPVVPSALPAHPDLVAAPGAVTAQTSGRPDLLVTWTDRPAAEEVSRYEVRVTPLPPANGNPIVVPAEPGQQLVQISGLPEDQGFSVVVRAYNDAGTTDSDPLQWSHEGPPPAPTNLQVSSHPITGDTTVSWAWASKPWTAAPTGFRVGVPGADPVVVGPGTRSVVVPVAYPTVGSVSVEALSGVGTATASTGPLTFAGRDQSAPTVGTSALLELGWPGRVSTLSLTARDDRALRTNPLQVRWRTATAGRRLGAFAYPAAWSAVPIGRFTTPALAAGTTACFSARSFDAAGNTSAWSSEQCTATPLDDRYLHRVGSTTTLRSTSLYGGTATQMTRTSSALTYPLNAASGYLVATACSTCGSVKVYVGSRYYGSLSLKNGRTRHRVLIRLPFPIATGTLTLRPARSGPKVIIDGLVVRAH